MILMDYLSHGNHTPPDRKNRFFWVETSHVKTLSCAHICPTNPSSKAFSKTIVYDRIIPLVGFCRALHCHSPLLPIRISLILCSILSWSSSSILWHNAARKVQLDLQMYTYICMQTKPMMSEPDRNVGQGQVSRELFLRFPLVRFLRGR